LIKTEEEIAELNERPLDISITAHSGIFRNFLAVLQHQSYPLATGEMIPVVVRATVNSANQDA
jgi:hypothetical protein